jgi:thioredoxin reductase
MAIDTPARIAILGAGPIGLEAALYARYLGYDVDLYERDEVAAHLRRWGHVRMFTPFGLNRSTLGLAALKAQNPDWQPPPDDALLTGRAYAEQYLIPLAQSDLLVDSLHLRTDVVAISRDGWLKGEGAGSEERADSDFQLLIRTQDASGHLQERIATAEAVIDTTGTFGRPNWLGPNGLPAMGEAACQARIEYGLPDLLGKDRSRYAGRSTLLIGDGDSAATMLVELAELAAQTPDTWVTWLTRPRTEKPSSVSTDIPERRRLAEQASRLAADDANHVTHLAGTTVASLAWHDDLDRFTVELAGEHAGPREFDRVIANVGYRGDFCLLDELQVEVCPQTGAPRTLEPGGVILSEPDLYVLGAKSYGRDGRFSIATGLKQIRQVFAIMGDRAELNLYASVANLV